LSCRCISRGGIFHGAAIWLRATQNSVGDIFWKE